MRRILILITFFAFINACSEKPNTEIHPEFKTYFDDFKVEGCFLLYDFQEDKTIIYNPERCELGFLPASTFKMVNTLIGLDNNIITGEDFVVPWDSVNRQIPVWNKEHNLASAFKYSVVPWYQELARQIGVETMEAGVEKAFLELNKYFGKAKTKTTYKEDRKIRHEVGEEIAKQFGIKLD